MPAAHSAPSGLALAFAPLALCACWQPTPFGTGPQDQQLNAEGVAQLAERASARPRFVAIGDSHSAYDELADTMRDVAGRPDIDFVAHLGDLSDVGLQQELAWTERALAESHKPTLVALGNHDALSSGRDVYREMYGPPDFSFVWAGVKWIFLNSNTLEFGRSVPSFPWLREQLAGREPGQPTVVLTHRPPAESEDPTERMEDAYRELFAEYPITLFVHGHLQDFHYYTLGTTPVLQCSSFNRTGAYAIVTLGPELGIERCRRGECAEILPQTEEDEP
jgi:3',5'-cyclic-AMP phosphodiesterase